MCDIHGPLGYPRVVTDLRDVHIHTDASQAAYRACVDCIRAHQYSIDQLPEEKLRENAKNFVLECIAYGNSPLADKIRALRFFIRRGWKGNWQVLEFIGDELSSKQLRWFLRHECTLNQYCLIACPKWDCIKVVAKETEAPNCQALVIIHDVLMSRGLCEDLINNIVFFVFKLYNNVL
jgi:hypothetical protein